jgi:hypothetical protein
MLFQNISLRIPDRILRRCNRYKFLDLLMSLTQEKADDQRSWGRIPWHLRRKSRENTYVYMVLKRRVSTTAWPSFFFVYNKFMHNCNHIEKRRNWIISHTHTKHDCTSSYCIFNRNISVTGHKQETFNFPMSNLFQGQVQTPQSVSVSYVHNAYYLVEYHSHKQAI